jgi:hypothetical protein
MSEPLFFIIEGNDVGVYPSINDAQRNLEAIDVIHSEYLGFDSEGRQLSLAVDSKKRVIIKFAEEHPTHQKDLEAILRKFLVAIGETRYADLKFGFPELVQACQKHKYIPFSFSRLFSKMFQRRKSKN